MILIACSTCGFALRVEGSIKDEDRELDSLVGRFSSFWPDNFPCVECGKTAVGLLPEQITDRAGAHLRLVDVTPQEAFAALNGLGLPKERSCLLEDVLSLMKTHGVKSISGKDIRGTSRCIIDFIELGDGSKVYLGPSADGATVYRVTKSHSYVKAMGEDHG